MRLYIAPNNTPEERLLRKNSECASRRGHGIKHGKVLSCPVNVMARLHRIRYAHKMQRSGGSLGSVTKNDAGIGFHLSDTGLTRPSDRSLCRIHSHNPELSFLANVSAWQGDRFSNIRHVRISSKVGMALVKCIHGTVVAQLGVILGPRGAANGGYASAIDSGSSIISCKYAKLEYN